MCVFIGSLGLGRNLIDGTIPSVLGSMVGLRKCTFRRSGRKHLVLSDTRLPSSVDSKTVVLYAFSESLGLEGNSITGTIPTELGKLTRLGSLNIGMDNNADPHQEILGLIPCRLFLFVRCREPYVGIQWINRNCPLRAFHDDDLKIVEDQLERLDRQCAYRSM